MARHEIEYTIGAIKPTAIFRGQAERIQEDIRRAHFSIIDQKTVQIDSSLADKIYESSQKKISPHQYKSLIDHSTTGPWIFFLATGENSIIGMKLLIGTTALNDRPARGLRGKYGEDKIQNAVHLTKTREELEQHIALFMPEHSEARKSATTISPNKNLNPQETKLGYHGEIVLSPNDKIALKSARYKNDHFPDELYREYLILLAIKDLNIAPKPIRYITTSLGIDTLAMELIEGTHWSDVSTQKKIKYLPLVGANLKRLHRETSSYSFFEAMGKPLTGNYQECLENNIEMLESFARRFGYQTGINFIRHYREKPMFTSHGPQEPEGYSLVHFDLSPGNLIILKNNQVKFIDWGMAHINDPAIDVARTIAKLTNGTLKEIKLFLQGYQPSLELMKRIFAYIPLAYLSSAIGRSEHNGEVIPKRAAFKHLKREEILNLAYKAYNNIQNIIF